MRPPCVQSLLLTQHWFRYWLVVCSALSNYLNRCWLIVNWALGNKLRGIRIRKYKTIHPRKCVWNCRLRNGGHFVQGRGGELFCTWTSVWANVVKDGIRRSRPRGEVGPGELGPRRTRPHQPENSAPSAGELGPLQPENSAPWLENSAPQCDSLKWLDIVMYFLFFVWSWLSCDTS